MIRMIAGDLDKTLIGASGRLTDFTSDVIRKYGFNIAEWSSIHKH